MNQPHQTNHFLLFYFYVKIAKANKMEFVLRTFRKIAFNEVFYLFQTKPGNTKIYNKLTFMCDQSRSNTKLHFNIVLSLLCSENKWTTLLHRHRWELFLESFQWEIVCLENWVCHVSKHFFFSTHKHKSFLRDWKRAERVRE
jgi:hypothetical protein